MKQQKADRRSQRCNGYLGHPFKKVATQAFIARLFHAVNWDSAIKRAGDWFS